jgi:dUTP pyrophosphatase
VGNAPSHSTAPEAIPIHLKRLPHGEGLPLPQRATEHSAGLDLQAAVDQPVSLEPGARALIPTGFVWAIPPGYEGQVRPRSGLALKHGITCLNTPGTIDSDYRGEVGVILANLGQESFTVERGMRIAQLVIHAVPACILREVEELDETERNSGGFGHTGVK